MTAASTPEDRASQPLDRLTQQLAALGAETPTERHVKRILPWVVSIAIHLGLVLLAVFITWTVANLPEKDESILIVADFNALQYQPVAIVSDSAENREKPTEVLDLAPPNPSPSDLLRELDRTASNSPALAGALRAPSADFSGLGTFAPRTDGTTVSFAGTSASNARKIVYAIDATGTMIAHFQIVIDELARSLSNLSPQQSFAIIFFQGENAIEVPPAGRLVPASAAERDRALKWIKANVVPKEGTNPLVAIEKAIKLKPDVVFMLSHGITGYGRFEIDQRDLLNRLEALNPANAKTGRRPVQINCIQFIDADPLDTMKLIAEQHGGPNGYKFLSRQELGLGGS